MGVNALRIPVLTQALAILSVYIFIHLILRNLKCTYPFPTKKPQITAIRITDVGYAGVILFYWQMGRQCCQILIMPFIYVMCGQKLFIFCIASGDDDCISNHCGL